jgi:glutaredoxin
MVPPADVVLYHAPGCHLCERARAILEELRGELEFDLSEVDISGDAELERRYRELLPVVEIDRARGTHGSPVSPLPHTCQFRTPAKLRRAKPDGADAASATA